MSTLVGTAPVSLELVDSSRHELALRRLMELYVYDFSELIDGIDVNDLGSYGDAPSFTFIGHPSVTSYLVRVEGRLAGFAMVFLGSRITDDRDVWDMNQFFILRRFRRSAVGTEAARLVFSRHPGRWEIRHLDCNEAAHHFWKSTVERFSGSEVFQFSVTRGGSQEVVRRFEIRTRPE